MNREIGDGLAARSPASIRNVSIYLIFTVSGASALIYQVIWTRWLGLVFGNTTTSVSIVLGSFMLGLALGSWLVGKRLVRIADPMLVYACLEMGIGLFALCFPWFILLTDWIFTILVTTETPVAASLFLRALLSFALIAIPTTLMGATLPLLTDFFRRSPRHGQTWKVGLLYATNTFGAALGTIAASFLFIELFGIRHTTVIAAAFNFFVGYLGFKYSRSTRLDPPGPIPDAMLSVGAMGKLALGVLAAGGGLALASEVLWTRALEMLIGNSTYAFAMILITYLLGIAAGSWVMSLFVNRLRGLPFWLAGVEAGMGLWTAAAIRLFDPVAERLIGYTHQLVPWSVLFLNYLQSISILLPLAILSGAAFPLATRILDPETEDAHGILIARAYAWNTLGSLFGSLLAGFGIAPLLGYFHALYLLIVLYALVALITVIVVVTRNQRLPRARMPAFALGLVAVGLIGFGTLQLTHESRFMVRVLERLKQWEVPFHKAGLQGITTVLQHRTKPMEAFLLINGRGMTRKVTDTKMMAHLPMLLHPDPQDTLILCFGMGTTYRSAITYGNNVTVVELVGEVYDAFGCFYEDAETVRKYPKGKMITNDARIFLKLTEERYDVITIDPPPPIDAAGVNHLYSRDFLELAKRRLKPGGILAHWVPRPGSRGGVDDLLTFQTVLCTFSETFPYTLSIDGWHGIGTHILGSMEPMNLSEDRIEEHLRKGKVARDINEWDQVPLSYFLAMGPLERCPELARSLVTDDRPRLEFNLLRAYMAGTRRTVPMILW